MQAESTGSAVVIHRKPHPRSRHESPQTSALTSLELPLSTQVTSFGSNATQQLKRRSVIIGLRTGGFNPCDAICSLGSTTVE